VVVLNITTSSNLPRETVSYTTNRPATRRLVSSSDQCPSDEALVGNALAGQRQAFDELIRRYQRRAVAVSYRLLGNAHDALEVSQDAFLKAYLNLASLQKPQAFGGWLMRIVSNLSLNFRRGRKSVCPFPLDDLVESPKVGASADHRDPAHRFACAEMGVRLRQALGELSDRQRSAVILFTIDQMPQKDVAETLGCSVEAVKWHVFQARKKLKEILKDYL
jgi:RNA polymerase sigma-70 factor, ECF subfamily